MPSVDDDLQRRIHDAAPAPHDGGPVFDDLIRRKRRRSVTRRASAVGVVALVLAGAIFAFAAVDRPSPFTPGISTPAPLAEDLGLPFPTCKVSSMPIGTGSGSGTAAVYTEVTGGECPARGDGVVGVGVDVTGDGALDATWGPLPDCWLRCEAFAAPDVNGDGESEIAVSTEGADGYGVTLYAVTTSPPSIAPITVSSTFGGGPEDGKPFQFGWVDVATHASSAGCTTIGEGTSFEMYATEKQDPAQVQTTSILVSGATATVTDISTDTMPLDLAPTPGGDLCAAPIYGSAATLASPEPPGVDLGLAFRVCTIARLPNVQLIEGLHGAVWTATRPTGDACGSPYDDPTLVIADLEGDGVADTYAPFECRGGCAPEPSGTTDLNGDGHPELIVNVQPFSIMSYQIFVVTADGRLVAATVGGDGHVQNGFAPGKPAVFSSGGDEGSAGSISCSGWPGPDTTITQTNTYHPVDSPSPGEGHTTTMRLVGSNFQIIAHTDFTTDPTVSYHTSAPACGVDWNPFS